MQEGRPEAEPAKPWHAMAPEEVEAALSTSLARGLTSDEAARRLAAYGTNEIAASRGRAWLSILAAQLRNVLVLILLVAVVLSIALGHATEAIVISVIVVVATLLGFVQEVRAEHAMDALRRLAAPTATVVREGRERDVPASELVPGDLVVLGAGDRVPADARLVEAVALRADEAALTGESSPVGKQAAAVAGPGLALGERRSVVFAGTALTHGRGRGLVVATGMDTEFGSIARLLEAVEHGRTPLQVGLDRLAMALARASIVVVLVVVGTGLARGEPFLEMLLFGAALAVAVVPEALPAVITISLTIAAQRMARRNALVRRLAASETLGGVSVICTDKTGTLTRDEMTVRKVFAGGRLLDLTGAGYRPEGAFVQDGTEVEPSAVVCETLRAAALASDATLEEHDGRWELRGDPTEGALVVAAAKAGLARAELDAHWPRTDEIPFTSERKRMTTLHRQGQGTVAYVKGAPEIVLSACVHELGPDGEAPLDDEGRARLAAAAQALASDALRVIAVARRVDPPPGRYEEGLTFLGLVGMIDPPRPEAHEAVITCRAAGIRPVMITGDHPSTARAIARELGVLRDGHLVTGMELEAMDEETLARRVEEIEVYARVSPADKLRVVTALQRNGHAVAMTGDGVNDAPALKKADIGVAMGVTGTDVARESAEITLTDDNFASIVAAVEEGRAVFANVRKYLMYLLSANLGEIGLLAGATLIGKPLPLSAVQILYVNLATDGLPALALAVDPADDDLMSKPPRSRGEGVFTRPIVALVVTGGLWSTAVTLGLFTWALGAGWAEEEAMTLTFTALVLVEFLKAFSYRTFPGPVWSRPFENRWLDLAIVWELLLLVAVLHVSFLQDAFGTTGLDTHGWLLAAAGALTTVPVLEIAKRVVAPRNAIRPLVA